MNRQNQLIQKVFIAIFCSLISLPLLLGSWSNDSVRMAENRMSGRIPVFKLILEAPRKFFKIFERYFDDRFGLRQNLVELHSSLKYFVFGVSSSKSVFLGKNNWLYWNMKGDGDNVDYYRGVKTLKPTDLSKMTSVLQARYNWMKSRGVGYALLVVPNKISIYPEFLPEFITRINGHSRLDRFIEFAKKHTKVNIIDPRPRLLAAKQHLPIYHKTDSHWNAYGAYASYMHLVDVLKKYNPRVMPLKLSYRNFRREPGVWAYSAPTLRLKPSFNELNRDPPSGDMADILGLGGILRDFSVIPNVPIKRCSLVVPTPYRPKGWEDVKEGVYSHIDHPGLLTTKCQDKPLNIIVLHDSFGPLLIPFLSETIGRVTYAWTDKFEFAKDLIDNIKKTDLVIQVQVERHLHPNYFY